MVIDIVNDLNRIRNNLFFDDTCEVVMNIDNVYNFFLDLDIDFFYIGDLIDFGLLDFGDILSSNKILE